METLPFMERMVQSRRLRGFGRVARIGEKKCIENCSIVHFRDCEGEK
jgi:hypothetical protein